MHNEVDYKISPFDPANGLCFFPRVLAGTTCTSELQDESNSTSTNGIVASSGILDLSELKLVTQGMIILLYKLYKAKRAYSSRYQDML